MRLLIVSNGYPPTAFGGVENYSADLARSLSAEGLDVSVVCAEHCDSAEDGDVIEDSDGGIPVFRIVNDFKRRIGFTETFSDPLIDSLLARLLEDLAPDVVHLNHLIALSAQVPHLIASQGIPFVYTFHDFWPLCQRVNLVNWQGRRCPGSAAGGDCLRCLTHGTLVQRARTWAIDRFRSGVPYGLRAALRRVVTNQTAAAPNLRPTTEALKHRWRVFCDGASLAELILTPSEFVAATYVANGYPADRIRVLALGMDTPVAGRSASQFADRRLRFGYVGSILPLKGVDVLVKAFRSIRLQGATLEIFGRDDIMPRYSRQLRRLAATDARVRFRGAFSPDEKDDIYGEMDVLVVPSRAQETFSFVVREAMLRGVPVVAARVGALPEAVSHGVNGWLFSPGDVDELAALLVSIIARPDALGALDLPGPLETLTVRDHVAALESIYAGFVSRHPV